MPGKRVRNLRSRRVRKSRSSRRVRKSRRVRSTKRSSKSKRRRVSRKMRGGDNNDDLYQRANNIYLAGSKNEIQEEQAAIKNLADMVTQRALKENEENHYESVETIKQRAAEEEKELARLEELTRVAERRKPFRPPESRKGFGRAAGARALKKARQRLEKSKLVVNEDGAQ